REEQFSGRRRICRQREFVRDELRPARETRELEGEDSESRRKTGASDCGRDRAQSEQHGCEVVERHQRARLDLLIRRGRSAPRNAPVVVPWPATAARPPDGRQTVAGRTVSRSVSAASPAGKPAPRSSNGHRKERPAITAARAE